ncbi:hypothetical protein I3843_07G012600 [Carya illinoinensis]|nr:hypothetical protein I3843_07G012600 [Carya illinoinensis]
MHRSNSTISSSSRIEPPDIMNEEDFSVEETDSSVNWNQWTIPQFKVKTVEQTCEVSNVQEKYHLFTKKSIQEFLSKGYKFLHIGSVQIAVKPLTRLGINASILLCLRDARHNQFETSILGMIQSSLFNGPVYFDCFPDLPLALNDPNILKALTLNIATSGYDMVKGSKPIAVIYRIYYRVLKSTLNPKTVLKSTGGKTLLIQSSTPDANVKVPTMIHWKDISLPNEWILNQEVPPAPILTAKLDIDYIQQYLDGTVKISFEHTPATTEDCERRDQNLNIFLTDSAKAAQPVLNNSDLKMKGLSTSSQITSAFYSAKDVETSKGKSIKEEANKDDEDASTLSPTASDMAASIAPLPSQLNVINRNYFEIDLISLFKDYNSKENRDKRKTYHATFSDLEKSRVKRKWKEEMNTKQKHILFFDFLENYYVSKNSLNVLQTDFVKEEGRTTVKSSHPPSEAIIISHLGVDLTASPFKAPNAESNDRETNTVLSETKKIIQQNNFSNTYLQTIGQQLDRIEEKIENPISIQSSKPVSQSIENSLLILPEKRPIFDLKTKQARTLDQINQMLQKIKTEKSSSSKPEKSSNALTNKEEEDGFIQTTDKASSESDSSTTREAIQHAVKKDDNGLPVFDPAINSTPFDGVNTLIYTIIKHFIGTPSNITNRVSDYLNNLRCRQMSDYRWYQDVFTSRVMLRNDSQKPYWKEKFIDGLPHLFALKVKDELTDISGFLNYDNLTYGDIFSVIKKLGISMCNDQRMLRQQLKNSKKAKYEMGTFCEQYGLPPIAPSRRKPKQFKQFSKPRGGYKRKPRDDFYKKSPNKKSFPKKKNFQNASKGKCFNCGKKGHFADKCTQKPNKFKNKLNALNISVIDQEELFQLMEMKASSSDMSEFNSSDSEHHSETGSSDSPIIKLGCNCTDSCCKPTGKTINVLSKGEE